MNKFKILAAAFAMTALSACGSAPAGPPPLEGAKMGGAFRLTNQDGKIVTDADFAGKYRLVYFGYTFCPDVCPVDVQIMGQGLSAFEKMDPVRGAKVVPIFITVDPVRDTPAVVKEGRARPDMISRGAQIYAERAQKYRAQLRRID